MEPANLVTASAMRFCRLARRISRCFLRMGFCDSGTTLRTLIGHASWRWSRVEATLRPRVPGSRNGGGGRDQEDPDIPCDVAHDERPDGHPRGRQGHQWAPATPAAPTSVGFSEATCAPAYAMAATAAARQRP